MKSGFQLKTMTSRTNGPTINATYPLGYFREDYEYIARPGQPDYLDEHNGRFCITPEYPTGTYAYFCTVDSNWNSAYPYAVGPTFYGVRNALKVTSITEPVTTFSGNPNANQKIDFEDFFAYGTPDLGFIAVQVNGMQVKDVMVNLLTLEGKLLESHTIPAGSTITYLNASSLHQGIYLVEMIQDGKKATKKLAYF